MAGVEHRGEPHALGERRHERGVDLLFCLLDELLNVGGARLDIGMMYVRSMPSIHPNGRTSSRICPAFSKSTGRMVCHDI